MYCKDLLVIAAGLCFCFIGGEAFAFKTSNFQTIQIVEADSFYPLSSLRFYPTISSSPFPSPNRPNDASDDFSTEMEKCKAIPQVGKREFCLGQALVKYGRLDEAKDHLRAARDIFKANGKPDKANEVENWARNNNVSL